MDVKNMTDRGTADRDVGAPSRDICAPPTGVRVIVMGETEPVTPACTTSSTLVAGFAVPAVYTATALPLTSVVPFSVLSVAPLLLAAKANVTA